MKNLAVLGSTGSIGKQTLDVVAGNPEHLHIKVLAAHKNASLMLTQIKKFQPELAVLTDQAAALELQHADHGRTEILSGEEGLLAAATYAGVDTVLAAMVGYAGLKPTLTAIEHGKNIALANKETLVAAGSMVMEAVHRHQVSLTPVDSEHSAIFQSLRAGKKSEVGRLIITASGGPFRGMSKAELAHVTLEQCLHHPNWSMGKKVTIDSSTLANKGLEVMEAHWLFDMPYDKIDVVIHPQSIVHSLVEYVDGAVIAQLGIPDMRLPIQYALSYPQRFNCHFGSLDLVKYGTLTFEKPDVEVFPLLQVAITCGREGGTLPCAFNAANEECVNAFLAGRIKYLDIPELVKKTVAAHKQVSHPTLEDIAAADKVTRETARKYLADI
jgi:1-deoxy-D-xylulose-5-phosphate reductoisomerase